MTTDHKIKEIKEMKEKIDALYALFFSPQKVTNPGEISLLVKQTAERSLKKRPLKRLK